MKDAGIFLDCKKNRRIFWVVKKKQRDFLGRKKSTIKGIFWGMLKKVVLFLDRQILKLGFLWV